MPRRPTPEIICARLQKAVDEVVMPDVPLDDRYIRTYPEMLSDFAQATKDGWTGESVVECVKLVYTWMPTRGELRIDMGIAEQIATELNIGTNTDRLIKLASELAKNSMVSGSKFLHFYDPARFPITDSWLQELSGKPDPYYRVDYYLDYKAGVHLVDEPHALRAQEWAACAFGYKVHRTRAIEAVAFYLIKAGWHYDSTALA